MKNILLLICLFPSLLFAQQYKVILKETYWAGGICCSSGTDFQLEIVVDPRFGECFEKVEFKFETIRLYLKDTQFTQQKINDSIVKYSYKFGNSANERYTNYHPGEELKNNTNYYGMTEKDLYYSDNYVNSITFFYNKRTTFEQAYELLESMIAYP